jgi:hypothetical protein
VFAKGKGMELKINNEAVAFELEENESQLGQILGDLIGYLRRSGYWHIEVYTDDEKVDLGNEEWREKPLAEIAVLNIAGEPVLELEETLEAARLALEALQQRNCSSMQKIGALWLKICHSLNFWLVDFNFGNDFFTALESFGVLLMHFDENEPLYKHAVKLIEVAVAALDEKNRELENPRREILRAIDELVRFKEQLAALAGYFQNGKDSTAMQIILAFMQAFQKLIRTSAFLTGSDVEEERKELINFIGELSEQTAGFTDACEMKDYILAGDIAEYEIAEKLDALTAVRRRLQQQ